MRSLLLTSILLLTSNCAQTDYHQQDLSSFDCIKQFANFSDQELINVLTSQANQIQATCLQSALQSRLNQGMFSSNNPTIIKSFPKLVQAFHSRPDCQRALYQFAQIDYRLKDIFIQNNLQNIPSKCSSSLAECLQTYCQEQPSSQVCQNWILLKHEYLI